MKILLQKIIILFLYHLKNLKILVIISNKAKYRIFYFTYDNYKNYFNSSIYRRNFIKDMLEDKFSCL